MTALSDQFHMARGPVRPFGTATARGQEAPTLNTRAIVNVLEANVIEADTIQGSEISEQRQRNHKMYSLDALGNEKKGRSQHITADVLDAVESQKSFYLEALMSGTPPVRFAPENSRDKTAHLASKYVDVQFFDKNDGYNILRDALHDAFVAKRCVLELDWSDEPEYEIRTFDGLNQPQVNMLFNDGRVEVLDAWVDPGIGMYGAEVRKQVSEGFVKARLVQPERYYRDPNVAYLRDSAFAGYQEDLTRFQMVERGFQEDEVNALKLDYRFRQNEEDSARKAHDATWSRARRHKRPREMEVVTVYTTYAFLDLSNFINSAGRGQNIAGTRLYKFVWSSGELLTLPNGELWEEVDDFPFVEWTQYKISHAEYGLCETDIHNDLQWTSSNLVRLLVDNQAMVNTTRWMGQKNAVLNPRELLDNNIGSTIWLKKMGTLEAAPTPPVSPMSFHLLEHLKQEKEQRGGMSRLSTGLNQGAISHQNSDDMVQRLTSASTRRVMRGVRDFAESFLAEVYVRVYNLGVRHDRAKHLVEVGGEWTELSPNQWPTRSRTKISVTMTPDEQKEQARFLTMLDQRMANDPKLAPLYGLKEQHALWADVCEKMDIEDVSRYLKAPDDPRVQQQLMQQAQMAQRMQQMQEQMTMLQAQLEMQKTQTETGKAQVEALHTQAKIEDMAGDNERADRELDHVIWKDEEELKLEREQERPVAV